MVEINRIHLVKANGFTDREIYIATNLFEESEIEHLRNATEIEMCNWSEDINVFAGDKILSLADVATLQKRLFDMIKNITTDAECCVRFGTIIGFLGRARKLKNDDDRILIVYRKEKF